MFIKLILNSLVISTAFSWAIEKGHELLKVVNINLKTNGTVPITNGLSEHVWDVKNCNKKFNITWEILDRTRSAVPGRICSLCNLERIHIALADQDTLINKRSELVGKCVHFPKFYHYN